MVMKSWIILSYCSEKEWFGTSRGESENEIRFLLRRTCHRWPWRWRIVRIHSWVCGISRFPFLRNREFAKWKRRGGGERTVKEEAFLMRRNERHDYCHTRESLSFRSPFPRRTYCARIGKELPLLGIPSSPSSKTKLTVAEDTTRVRANIKKFIYLLLELGRTFKFGFRRIISIFQQPGGGTGTTIHQGDAFSRFSSHAE